MWLKINIKLITKNLCLPRQLRAAMWKISCACTSASHHDSLWGTAEVAPQRIKQQPGTTLIYYTSLIIMEEVSSNWDNEMTLNEVDASVQLFYSIKAWLLIDFMFKKNKTVITVFSNYKRLACLNWSGIGYG